MDIISHALLTNLVFQELPLPQRAVAIGFGVLPDIISFGALYNGTFLRKVLFFKKPPLSIFPAYVLRLYHIFHSLLIWLAVFIIVKIFAPAWLAIAVCGWGFHIVLDIFTHSSKSFPTRILWPLSNFHFSGIAWSNKWFMLFNYLLILLLYIIFYF